MALGGWGAFLAPAGSRWTRWCWVVLLLLPSGISMGRGALTQLFPGEPVFSNWAQEPGLTRLRGPALAWQPARIPNQAPSHSLGDLGDPRGEGPGPPRLGCPWLGLCCVFGISQGHRCPHPQPSRSGVSSLLFLLGGSAFPSLTAAAQSWWAVGLRTEKPPPRPSLTRGHPGPPPSGFPGRTPCAGLCVQRVSFYLRSDS